MKQFTKALAPTNCGNIFSLLLSLRAHADEGFHQRKVDQQSTPRHTMALDAGIKIVLVSTIRIRTAAWIFDTTL